jgi:hypothetical protein
MAHGALGITDNVKQRSGRKASVCWAAISPLQPTEIVQKVMIIACLSGLIPRSSQAF